MTQFYQFSMGFIQQSNEIDDLIKKIIQAILSSSICDRYKEKLHSTSISVAAQIMLNCKWFSIGCEDLETLLLDKRFSTKTATGLMAPSVELFDEVEKLAEQRIFEVVKIKINNFMDLIEYNWSATTSRSDHSPVLNGRNNFLSNRYYQLFECAQFIVTYQDYRKNSIKNVI